MLWMLDRWTLVLKFTFFKTRKKEVIKPKRVIAMNLIHLIDDFLNFLKNDLKFCDHYLLLRIHCKRKYMNR
jgi:hypothetical protein